MRQTVRRAVFGLLATLLLPALASAQPQQQPEDLPVDPTGLEFRLASILIVLVVLSIVAALLIHLGRNFTLSTVQYVRKDAVETGIVGFAVLVGTVIVAFILTITFIGAIVGIPLFLALFLILIVGSVIAYIALGYEVLKAATDVPSTVPDNGTLWKSFGVGYVVVTVVSLIPIVNFLVSLVVGSLGLGSAIQHWRNGAYGASDAPPESEGRDDGPAGGGQFDAPDAGAEWSDSDPRDPSSTGDEFGAPGDGDQWESAPGDDQWGSDGRDDRDEWSDANSSKRDDRDNFW